jgi:hypothetical protein
MIRLDCNEKIPLDDGQTKAGHTEWSDTSLC